MRSLAVALALAFALVGCASNGTPATPVAHESQYDVIPLDAEAPYVHVLGANTSEISLHVGGLASAGDVPPGPDNGTSVTLSGSTINLRLESRESATATSKLTPIWVVSLHGVAPGNYTLRVELARATCTGDACATKDSKSASTKLCVSRVEGDCLG